MTCAPEPGFRVQDATRVGCSIFRWGNLLCEWSLAWDAASVDTNSRALRHPRQVVAKLAEIDAGRLRDPHVAFFQKMNPGHLRGDELVCLPEEFELKINDRFGVFVPHRVKRVWSRGDAIGVAFIDSARERDWEIAGKLLGDRANRRFDIAQRPARIWY